MIVASVILSFIIIDMVFSFAGTTISVSANWEISLFVVIALAFAISQYLILDFIKNKTYACGKCGFLDSNLGKKVTNTDECSHKSVEYGPCRFSGICNF